MFRGKTFVILLLAAFSCTAEPVSEPVLKSLKKACFTMGFWFEDDPEESRYKVCLDAFDMMAYEVTNAEYRQFDPNHDSGQFDGRDLNAAKQPVVNVTRKQAQAYAKWLSKKTGKHYRLPTEAQWEYAAKAGTQTEAYWGDDLDLACEYANIGDRVARKQYRWIIWHNCKDGAVVSNKVGSYKPNQFGLYDMLGNVSEWTCSEYQEPLSGKEQVCEDDENGFSFRVIRGGNWATKPDFNGTSVRYATSNKPLDGLWDVRLQGVAVGFRLVRLP